MIRFFDIVFSLIAVIILSPVFIIVSILLFITGEHEILYIQKRVGKGNKLFNVFKFTTMMKNSEKMEGGEITRKNDPRVLPLGAFLRKTKINELPQLLNILFGSMSIIGYRPLVKSQFDMYSPPIREKLGTIKPGLSGIGSVFFIDEDQLLALSPLGYDECFEKVITPYKGALEAWYTENRTVANYFKLIILTVVVVISPKSSIVNRVFKNLPEPSKELKELYKKYSELEK